MITRRSKLGELPGRDRRAVRHPGSAGSWRDNAGHRVAVIGGGVAGLAAATALAERGVQVVLLEREEQLGGRVRAWPVQQADERATMSRGFHAFFRQYYNLRSLLRRADPELTRLIPVGDYPLLAAGGQRDSFAKLPRTPPVNMLAFLLRSKAIRLRELANIDTDAAHELVAVEFPATFEDYTDESASAFLDRLRFPVGARHLALQVFSRSFFADPDDFSAGELIAMFHAYFIGSAEGLVFDVPDDDYESALWAPLRRYLDRREVTIRTGECVRSLHSGADEVRIRTDADEVLADAVVIATDLASTQQLIGQDAQIRVDDGWRERLSALRNAPPFAVWRLWLDRPAAADRPAFLGTAGFGCVDNVSVLDRFEAGATDWARRHGGCVVEIHAYALPETVDAHRVQAEMRAVLDRIYPELATAEVLAEEYLVRADCPLIGVHRWSDRPGVSTPDDRVLLAGDGIRCEYPVALMERAATTGFQAANELLRRWGLAGHELWTVPVRSRFPVRRRPRAEAPATTNPAAPAAAADAGASGGA